MYNDSGSCGSSRREGERIGRRNGGGGDANAEARLQDAIREGSHVIPVATVRSEQSHLLGKHTIYAPTSKKDVKSVMIVISR